MENENPLTLTSNTEETPATQPEQSSEKYYFLNKHHEFQECELIKTTPHRRIVKLIEGVNAGKEMSVHPDGVAWGKMYPRLFKSEMKPSDFFIFRGRVIMGNPNQTNLVPSIDSEYRLQPFLSHVIDCVNSSENTLLTGGAGVGKTTHIEQLAARTNNPLVRVNMNGETRLSDFLGKIHVVNGQTKWVDGVLPMAMREGNWLLLDEIDMADPAILSLLHPVLEPNPRLVLKENNGEVIVPHSNFRVFATANSVGAMQDKASTYAGTNHMNEAFLDRWQVLMVPNLSLKEEIKIIKGKVKGLKSRWAKRIVEFAHKVRDRQVEGIEFSSDSFSTRRVLSWAKKTALLRSPIAGARLAWLDKMPSGEHESMIKILELHFGSIKGKRKKKESPLTKTALSLNTSAPGPQKRGRGRPKKVQV